MQWWSANAKRPLNYTVSCTKLPVCGECICFPEHQICVVRTYSEWVIDGEYDWPPKWSQCQVELGEGTGSQTTRLGCLHVLHTNCLISHIKSFPLHTAPAGHVCPACSTSIWPPKSVKDSGSSLHSSLKEAIMLTGLEKNLFGNYPVSLAATESRGPPLAFASDPLVHHLLLEAGRTVRVHCPWGVQNEITAAEGYSAANGARSSKLSVTDPLEIDGPSTAGNFVRSSSPPGATTRKGAFHVEWQNSEISYYADDEDGNHKKYTRRGPFKHKFLRALLPFWSSTLPTLLVTAPQRKDASNGNDTPEGRVWHQRSSRMDPRKVMLFIALMACMATMGILYYRLVQRGLGVGLPEDEQQ